MYQCPKCNSENVRNGTLSSDGSTTGVLFQPDRVKFFTGWLRGTRCDKKVTACVDCGLVWTFTPVQELREFLSKYGK
jgi:hypothetical protein